MHMWIKQLRPSLESLVNFPTGKDLCRSYNYYIIDDKHLKYKQLLETLSQTQSGLVESNLC